MRVVGDVEEWHALFEQHDLAPDEFLVFLLDENISNHYYFNDLVHMRVTQHIADFASFDKGRA